MDYAQLSKKSRLAGIGQNSTQVEEFKPVLTSETEQPAAAPAPKTLEQPVTAPTEHEAPKMPKKPKAPMTTNATRKLKTKAKNDESALGKYKYTAYLQPQMKQLIAIAAAFLTDGNASRLGEIAIEDILSHRYKCQNPACNAEFTIFQGEEIPTCCPVCAEKKVRLCEFRF